MPTQLESADKPKLEPRLGLATLPVPTENIRTSAERIHRDLEEFFVNRIHQGVSPLSVRMKVYHAYCQLLQTECDKLHIATLAPPQEALNDVGALQDAYALGCTHANERYGKLVAQQLLQEQNT